jgi:hypothetical protein
LDGAPIGTPTLNEFYAFHQCVAVLRPGVPVACRVTPGSGLSGNQQRIYFYRTQVLGAAVQPSIRVNNQKVGSCVPNGVFYKDFVPGNYEITVETEVERKLTLSIAASDEKYIRCYITMGFFVGHGNLELVDPAEARRDTQNLSFIKN